MEGFWRGFCLSGAEKKRKQGGCDGIGDTIEAIDEERAKVSLSLSVIPPCSLSYSHLDIPALLANSFQGSRKIMDNFFFFLSERLWITER